MAGDWIKIEHAMPDKPEVSQLAELLGVEHDAVVGKLIRFWIWADAQSVDGNALGVTSSFLDRLTNCPGFSVGLAKVGWLEHRNGRVSVPNFGRHNGQTAKSRALTKDRVKRSRNDHSVTASLPEKRREEKRRVKEEDTPAANGKVEISASEHVASWLLPKSIQGSERCRTQLAKWQAARKSTHGSYTPESSWEAMAATWSGWTEEQWFMSLLLSTRTGSRDLCNGENDHQKRVNGKRERPKLRLSE